MLSFRRARADDATSAIGGFDAVSLSMQGPQEISVCDLVGLLPGSAQKVLRVFVDGEQGRDSEIFVADAVAAIADWSQSTATAWVGAHAEKLQGCCSPGDVSEPAEGYLVCSTRALKKVCRWIDRNLPDFDVLYSEESQQCLANQRTQRRKTVIAAMTQFFGGLGSPPASSPETNPPEHPGASAQQRTPPKPAEVATAAAVEEQALGGHPSLPTAESPTSSVDSDMGSDGEQYVEVDGRHAPSGCDSGMYRLVDDDPANEFVQVQLLIPPGTTLVYEVPRDAVRPGKSPLKMMSRAQRREQQQLEHVLRISVSETASSRKVKKRPADNDSPEFLQSARAGMNECGCCKLRTP